ncbi:MAG: hypothetical protein EA361_14330 [Bacteroidetes bacterium]|nr:MAG: hypothetical protein EA361_14330 [Bacteroidota bacterium]
MITSEEFTGKSFMGKRQYLNLVRLRAIETNRNIIKCSNNGLSAVINEKGKVTYKISNEFETVNAYRINKPSFLQRFILYP